MFAVLLILELIILYVLSRRLTQNIYSALFLLTRSRPFAISVLSILFFPGTVIHELAHLFTAEILGVPTSGLTLVPEGLEESDVKTGSVAISQTDPIRRALIGTAPVYVGIAALATISYFLSAELTGAPVFGPLTPYNNPPVAIAVFGYLLFAVSNTMFSSKEDMEGFWPVALVVGLIVAALYVIGVRIDITSALSGAFTDFLTSLATNIGWITGLNVVLFLCSRLSITAIEKITKRRLVYKT